MMQMYLWNGNQYSDFADYPDNPPFAAPAGWQWVEGKLPENAKFYTPLSQELTSKFQTLIQQHINQPYCTSAVILSIVQIQSGVLLNADNPSLAGLSKVAIQALTLPTEMQPDQQTLLALFP
jgi:hypothetical protein